MPPAHVYGHVTFLWEACWRKASEIAGDAVDVELQAGWKGQRGQLVEALLACGTEGSAGLLEPTDGRPGVYTVHGFWEHAPQWVDDRRTELDRKAQISEIRRAAGKAGAKARWDARDGKSGTPEAADVLATSVPDGKSGPLPPCDDGNCQDLPSETAWQNGKLPHLVLDLDLATTTAKTTKSRASAREGQASLLEDPIVAWVPVIGPEGPEVPVYDSKCREWETTWPGFDVRRKVRELRQYFLDKPQKRVTGKGLNGFIGGCLRRDFGEGRYRDAYRLDSTPAGPVAPAGNMSDERAAALRAREGRPPGA